jgi:hypothetical protein
MLKPWQVHSVFIKVLDELNSFFYPPKWQRKYNVIILTYNLLPPPQDRLCLPHHILEERGLLRVCNTVQALLDHSPAKQTLLTWCWGTRSQSHKEPRGFRASPPPAPLPSPHKAPSPGADTEYHGIASGLLWSLLLPKHHFPSLTSCELCFAG